MLSRERWHDHSYSIYRAFDQFKTANWDVYKLDGSENIDSDILGKLRVSVRFVSDLIELLEKFEKQIDVQYSKPSKTNRHADIYDRVAELMSEIIYNAAGVSNPWWPCWQIQHNTVWSEFFGGFNESKTRNLIAFRLRRLIYNEVIEFDKYEGIKSFKAARYLGICLNCMGFKQNSIALREKNTWPLQKVILAWVKKNFVSLYESHPTVAKACLMGSITYDAESKQLVLTYRSRPDQEPNRDFFSLS
jgi:hypothetical protein